MMTFMIGDKVVYPNQGVATIENISVRSFGANFEKFYLLRLIYGSMTVMVPFSNAGNIGLRKITNNQDVCRVLSFLAAGRCCSSNDWKCRFKENADKMQSGSLIQVAEVLKSLLLLQAEKPLSFREKKMLDRARHLLVTEVTIARRVPESEARTLLEKSLNKAGLAMPAVL
ncbi:MAG: CarD family transcriptional regulator [Acidobacteria bacterium]|nr:CarD family transcriptional regulator [Acidobacteriota bacterium]MBI3472755.1 CarD family transcriptional regulator [Candidatus Solibacter usitatus]